MEAAPAEARLLRPNRQQLELRPADLDGLLPAEHRARVVWHFVEGLDLGPLYAQVKAVEGHAGRPAIDPAIRMALWLYATLEGVGSARALARLCEEHDAYRWLCGGVAVNYHTLADFRGGTGEYLDEVLTTSVVALMAEGPGPDAARGARRGEGAGQCGGGFISARRPARAIGGGGPGAGRGVEARSARRSGGHDATGSGGAAAGGARAPGPGGAGLGRRCRRARRGGSRPGSRGRRGCRRRTPRRGG